MSPHRRDEDPEHVVYMPKDETGAIGKYNQWWDRYMKLFWPAIWGVMTWVLFQLIPAVKGYPDIVERLNKADEDRAAMSGSLKILIKMQCLQLDALDRAKIDLNCADIPLPTAAELRSLK